MDIEAYIKGDVGEAITAQEMRNKLGMLTVRNMLFPIKSSLTEVDIVGLDKRGVFIVENKNYSGKVTPLLDKEYWWVRYPSYMVELYNPVLQNRKHVQAFCLLLRDIGLDYVIPYVNPVVVFNDGVLRKKVYSDREKVLGRYDFIENFDFLYPVENNIGIKDLKFLQEILQKYKIYSEI